MMDGDIYAAFSVISVTSIGPILGATWRVLMSGWKIAALAADFCSKLVKLIVEYLSVPGSNYCTTESIQVIIDKTMWPDTGST